MEQISSIFFPGEQGCVARARERKVQKDGVDASRKKCHLPKLKYLYKAAPTSVTLCLLPVPILLWHRIASLLLGRISWLRCEHPYRIQGPRNPAPQSETALCALTPPPLISSLWLPLLSPGRDRETQDARELEGREEEREREKARIFTVILSSSHWLAEPFLRFIYFILACGTPPSHDRLSPQPSRLSAELLQGPPRVTYTHRHFSPRGLSDKPEDIASLTELSELSWGRTASCAIVSYRIRIIDSRRAAFCKHMLLFYLSLWCKSRLYVCCCTTSLLLGSTSQTPFFISL